MVYLKESEFELGIDKDLNSSSQAIQNANSAKWLDAMKKELKSIDHNNVWDLVELLEGCKEIECKYVYMTKCDSNGNVKWYNARLIAKGFTKKECIDYKEIFSLVSKKDLFRIMMTLVAHYNLALHQMDVKTVFLNGNFEEVVYTAQPEGFSAKKKEHLLCKLKKSINKFKQASR